MWFNTSSCGCVTKVLSRENELHNEGGAGDERVAEHNVGADEDTVRFSGNHRRAEVISARVS